MRAHPSANLARRVPLAAVACTMLLYGAPARASDGAETGAPPQLMTLQQAVDFALVRNQAVLKAVAAASDAGATLARERAVTLPTINGVLQSDLAKSANSGQFAQIGAAVAPAFSQNTAELAANFNGLNLTNIYQARSAKAAYDQANQQLFLAREQTTLDVETAFYRVVQDEQLTEIANENVNYNRVLQEIAEVNFRAGKVAGLDELKAQVAYTSAVEQHTSAEADQEDAREDLAQLIGAPMSQQFALPAAPPEPPLPNLDKTVLNKLALANRPEVAIAQAQLDSAYISYSLVDAPNRPNVSMQGFWGNQVSPTNNAQLVNQCTAEGLPPAQCQPGASHFYQLSVISQWSLPLVDYGTVHSGHVSAHREIDAQMAGLASAKQQALIDVDQAVRRLLVQRDNLTLAAKNVEVAKQAAYISAVQYKVGIISQTDVSVAQQSYLSAARDLLNAQVAYVLGIASLKKATGTLTGAL
jgi:outer membrane protein TolC